MISLKSNGIAFDLNRSTIISMEERLPLYATDSFPSEFSYNIDLPMTPNNKRIIGFFNLPSENNPSNIIPVQFSAGHTQMNGMLEYSIKGSSIQALLRLGGSDVYTSFFDKKLCDLDYGGLLYQGTFLPTFAKATTLNPDKYDVVFFPVVRDRDDDGNNFTDPVNDWKSSENRFVGRIFPPQFTESNLFSPFPFLRSILKYVFRNAGFNVKDFAFSTGELRNVCLFSNFFANNSIGPNSALAFDTTINLRNHVPDMDVNSFLRSIVSFFNTIFFFDLQAREVTVRLVRDYLTDCEFIDLSRDRTGRFNKQFTTQPGLKYIDSIDPNDDVYKTISYVDNVSFGNAQKEIKTNAGTLLARQLHPNLLYKFPISFSPFSGYPEGSDPLEYVFQSPVRSAVPRFMIYRGYVQANNGYNGPFGSSDITLTGTTDLTLPERFNTFFNTNLLQRQNLQSCSEVFNLRFDKLNAIKKGAGIIIDSVKFIPTRLSYDLPASKGIVKTQVEMFRL